MKSKKKKIIRNFTKKCRPSQKDLTIYCRQHANTFNQFEEQYETDFKKDYQQSIEKELIKLFKTPFTPTKYRAQDDYYTYINYQWLSEKTQELKTKLKHYVQIDSFRVTQEKVYYELIDIVKEYIKKIILKKQPLLKMYMNLYII